MEIVLIWSKEVTNLQQIFTIKPFPFMSSFFVYFKKIFEQIIVYVYFIIYLLLHFYIAFNTQLCKSIYKSWVINTFFSKWSIVLLVIFFISSSVFFIKILPIPCFTFHEEVGDLRGSPAYSWTTFLGWG